MATNTSASMQVMEDENCLFRFGIIVHPYTLLFCLDKYDSKHRSQQKLFENTTSKIPGHAFSLSSPRSDNPKGISAILSTSTGTLDGALLP
ncbi:hypothetical protein JTB14_034161 [Gonioctena quinquepunctata]|nr:hypothetical protein JTB14_034161 [Gonioctena quinquepunctata]